MTKEYELEYLQKPGLLQFCFTETLQSDLQKGLHVGFFNKDEFNEIEDFYFFISNISSLTQEWFLTKDLKSAYEFYYPEDLTALKPLKETNTREELKDLRAWLEQNLSICDLDELPYELSCLFYWDGDLEELRLIGETTESYFEIYIADKVE